MKSLIKEYQISIFFTLTFVLSWFPWYMGIAPEVLTVGPSIAAFILVFIIGGKRGFVDLVRPFGRWRASLGLWGIALFGMAILYLCGLGVHLFLGGELPPFTMIREELNLIPLYLVMVVLMPWNGPVGEEFGWRGYALPRLQQRYGPLIASLVIGVMWGLWHLPTFFAPQGVLAAMVSAVGLVFIIPYTLTTIANSIFMTWLYNKSNASALLAGIVWHAAINFWAPLILSDSSLVAAREGTHLPTIAPALYLTVTVVLVVAGHHYWLFSPGGKLGYSTLERMKKLHRRLRRGASPVAFHAGAWNERKKERNDGKFRADCTRKERSALGWSLRYAGGHSLFGCHRRGHGLGGVTIRPRLPSR